MGRLTELLNETGAVAKDVAAFANQSINQTAAAAAGGLAGLVAAGAESFREGGDPGAAFRAVQKGVQDKTTLPAPTYTSSLGKATGEAATPILSSVGTGMADMIENTGKHWEGATGSTTVGGVTAALASVATDAVELFGRVKLPDASPTKQNIIGGKEAAKKLKGKQALEQAQKDAAAGMSNSDMLRKHGMWKDDMGQLRVWIDDDAAILNYKALGARKLNDLDGKTVTQKMSDIVSHEALYKVYPGLRNAKVNITFDSSLEGGRYFGDFDPETNTVTVSAAPNEVMKPLLHEVQHWVQKKEKLVNGTSEKWETLAVLRNPRLVDMEGGRSMAAKYQQIEKLMHDYMTKADSDVSDAEFDALLVARDSIDGYARYRGQIAEREASAVEGAYRNGPRNSDGTLVTDPLAKAEAVLSKVENAVGADGVPVKVKHAMEAVPGSMDDFLDKTPSLWGNRLALEHITDDPELVAKYSAKETPQQLIRGFRDGHVAEAQAWHGARDSFDSFMLKFMGSGEGAQMYGWGIYATKKFGVARDYRKSRHEENERNRKKSTAVGKRIVFDMDDPKATVTTPLGETFTFTYAPNSTLEKLVGAENVDRYLNALQDGRDKERLIALSEHNKKMDEFAQRIEEISNSGSFEPDIWSVSPLVHMRGAIKVRTDGSIDFGLSMAGGKPSRLDESIEDLTKVAMGGGKFAHIAKEFRDYIESTVDFSKLGKLREDTVYAKIPEDHYKGPTATMYELDLPEDHELFVWHKSYSEQSPQVQEKLADVFTEVYYNADPYYSGADLDMKRASQDYLESVSNNPSPYDANYFGRDFQRTLEVKIGDMDWDVVRKDDVFGIRKIMEQHHRDINRAGTDEILSFVMLKHGIPGHLFKPEMTRGSHENYVIYDTERIKIVDKDHDPEKLSQRARAREALKNKETSK